VVSRQGLAILGAIGRGDWVARDAAQYLDLAVGLAGDLAGRTHWRGALRAAMRAAPLGDPVRLARALEETYRDLCA
jgi:predicted O-linked N-acetylglucosamine transferase (SPINDLY family)